MKDNDIKKKISKIIDALMFAGGCTDDWSIVHTELGVAEAMIVELKKDLEEGYEAK